MQIEDLLRLVICPRCGAELRSRPDGLTCSGCAQPYPIIAGVPELLDDQQRERLSTLRSAWGGQRVGGRSNARLVALVRRFVPPGAPFLNLASGRNLRKINRELRDRGPATLLLDIGSGAGEGAGMSEVDTTLLRDRTVFLDIAPFRGVNLVGEGARTPLASSSFDAVLLKAVLEHVPDAPAVLAEARRVLKPHGILYAEIPFMFEYHPNPGDYVRFTRMGLERLFADFAEVEVGTLVGPATALASLTAQCLALAASCGHLGARKALHPWCTWLTWPLCLPDLLLTRLPDSHVVAHHLYVIARRERAAPP